MAIEPTDDGTMDTVLRCSECGEEMRYTYDPQSPNEVEDLDADQPGADDQQLEAAYDAFVEWAIEDATADHECVMADDDESDDESDDEPDEDAITTADHARFYQYGKLILWVQDGDSTVPADWSTNRGYLGTFTSCEDALRAYMEREQFWPDVYFVSDHGNAHRIDLSGGK
jgi:hypothetical protein